ncbi:MAG: dTMP kinase [Candidatus Eremiobacteraeota bacterium]|nr:dTMP kinase [Candidatus Eremiobacteraeota bacterium]
MGFPRDGLRAATAKSVPVLVTFEGIEAAGKSTLIEALAQDLGTRGEPVLVTREPGGTPLGDALRAIFLDPSRRVDPMAEVMLLNASRAQLVADVIAPALRTRTTVLCDRFFDATVAYQSFGRGLDVESVLEVCLVATQRIAPDLTFLIDIPVALSRERVRARGGADRLERENGQFHEQVRSGYLALAERFAKRYVVLDGTLPREALAAAAREHIEQRRNAALP